MGTREVAAGIAAAVMAIGAGLHTQAPPQQAAPAQPAPVAAEAPRPRPTPPTRPGLRLVTGTELPDGTLPRPTQDGNFIIGPTHTAAPETIARDDVPKGTTHEFTITSAESTVYPDGIARDPGTFGTPDPANPAKLDVPTSRPAPWTRKVTVFVPAQYVPGTVAPFIVGADGPDPMLFTTLENLIAQKRLPVMVGIAVANGGGDAQGSQRGREYDTLSGRYAEFIEKDVLPQVEKRFNVRLTKDPDQRATMGCSSGAAAALSMAWYRTDLYHRVLGYSGTYVNQQWPWNPETPQGAWGYHTTLIPNTPRKPLRIWMHVGDRDLYNPNVMRDQMHDWVEANERMAQALTAKGYPYQFMFVRNAGHCDRAVKAQTLPTALEYVWTR
jgi:enterochelin esterase-like enzyme